MNGGTNLIPRWAPKPQGVTRQWSPLRSRAGPPHGLSEKAPRHIHGATTRGDTRPSVARAHCT